MSNAKSRRNGENLQEKHADTSFLCRLSIREPAVIYPSPAGKSILSLRAKINDPTVSADMKHIQLQLVFSTALVLTRIRAVGRIFLLRGS